MTQASFYLSQNGRVKHRRTLSCGHGIYCLRQIGLLHNGALAVQTSLELNCLANEHELCCDHQRHLGSSLVLLANLSWDLSASLLHLPIKLHMHLLEIGQGHLELLEIRVLESRLHPQTPMLQILS